MPLAQKLNPLNIPDYLQGVDVMTKVAIVPVLDGQGHIYFDAVAGDRRARGMTAGAALDAMNEQLMPDEGAAIIVLQNFRPDVFFGADQQQRLDKH